MMNFGRLPVGINAPAHVATGPAPATSPNTGMAPHPMVQQGPSPVAARPTAGANQGEIGMPWNLRFGNRVAR